MLLSAEQTGLRSFPEPLVIESKGIVIILILFQPNQSLISGLDNWSIILRSSAGWDEPLGCHAAERPSFLNQSASFDLEGG
jgi:hypothetical protein